jgi:hypothetical protein
MAVSHRFWPLWRDGGPCGRFHGRTAIARPSTPGGRRHTGPIQWPSAISSERRSGPRGAGSGEQAGRGEWGAGSGEWARAKLGRWGRAADSDERCSGRGAIGRGAGARTGWPTECRAGPSVEAASEAANLAVRGAACLVDDQVAGAAVGAAVGSVGRGRAAPQAAGCHTPTRDRHGRGTRIHSVVFLVARLAGAGSAHDAASRPWFARDGSNHENRSENSGFLSGATAGAGWARPAVRFCGPGNDGARWSFRQMPRSRGAIRATPIPAFQHSFRNSC